MPELKLARKWLASPAIQVWGTPWLWVLVLFAFAEITWLSLARYYGFNLDSFDLGNMSQAIWSVSQGRPLIYTTDGIPLSRLGWHVELFYFLLAPLYGIWPSPAFLLLLQAAMYAMGALPIYRLACRRIESRRVALILAALYLFYPVAQTATLFQFHADTLAMPLLLWALEALDRKAIRSYCLWLVAALSCKLYVAAPCAALGVLLWFRGERRVGLATAVLAIAWGCVAFFLVRPHFQNPAMIEQTAAIPGYAAYYFSLSSAPVQDIIFRFVNALVVVGPVLTLLIRAPAWLLPASATLVPVLLSSGPGPSYDYRYHHYALAVPFLLAGAVYGAERIGSRCSYTGSYRPKLGPVMLTLAMVLLFNIGLVDTPLSPAFYFSKLGTGRGLTSTGYAQTDRDEFKDRWVREFIPESAPVMADDLLGTRLTNRSVLYRTRPQFTTTSKALADVEYVAVDALFDFAAGSRDQLYSGGVASEHLVIRTLLQESSFKLHQARDGLLLFDRGSAGIVVQLESFSIPEEYGAQAEFGGRIGLGKAAIVGAEGSRYLFTLEWIALRSMSEEDPYIAVSQIRGISNSRIVHLPTLAILPTDRWSTGQVIREIFEFDLPPDTPRGNYPLFVGWYDTKSPFAAETDHRSRLGNEVEAGVLTVQ